MVELTLKIDPRTFTVSVIHNKAEICDPLSKPTAEELGGATIDHVERTASVQWPKCSFRMQNSNNHFYVRGIVDSIITWTPDFEKAKVFTNDATFLELRQNHPTLIKITSLG
jgi:hypothetical protein